MKLGMLFEDIFRSLSKPGYIGLSVNTNERKHRSGDRESISTAVPLPLRMTASKTRGVPVYYAYNYLHSEEVTELLKAIKGKSTLQVDTRQLELFFKDTVNYLTTGLKQRKITPDLVVCPASSSPLTHEFAMRLAHSLGSKIVTDAFLKQKAFQLPADRDEALQLISTKFVDHELIAVKYHGEDVAKFTNRVALSIYSSIKKHGALELKGVDKQIAKFVKGFMDKDINIEYEIMDKDVLVVDDVLSSGATMSEITRLVKDECMAKTVNGVVIFNMTTGKI